MQDCLPDRHFSKKLRWVGGGGSHYPYMKYQKVYPRSIQRQICNISGESGNTGSRSLRVPLELEDIMNSSGQMAHENCPK